MKKQLNVSAIKQGTVIDHIPTTALFKVISILKLDECKDMVTFGNNLDSNVMEGKAIIKVENRFFKDKEINKIALVAPHAKLNTIKDYEVVEKYVVEIPDEIQDIARCFNPKCITNNENIDTHFEVISKSPVALKCHYCEKITHQDQMDIK
ncbi:MULTISPECIES: aspartate carbamoyltransferase regulatory subunit [Prolixibacter]|jgi:aspartate carbamoyltransferase regulatory subunit|uniref:Aspartate carbamoyltransferase regulatory chain n=1 Tax=Prolixibacter denitrificans TaxID=1541063 RepID=A0A2P8CE34_9BACT|nr:MULTISPECIES: aspartate carbamoyltransferase regulatory subunit [Prolixibacter]PSK83230.1 aspartate carbamoyltransferase regulatory subunit [Prolixibacter denitrificans]GET21887.1 aspartate carbamoyltransferase regulatory chain [Prolixibacter denitrificans]GET24586.1 aspartate carbamoyltransferase regulatory chain [Prolixibacter sp. NT017]